jgi:radical SAM protein with 4Fe4S-binding SPASM domain
MIPLPRFKKIYLEIGNVCNLQCSFCPEVERQKMNMTDEQFSHILPKILPHGERFTFHLMGEPLIHPQFRAFLKMASDQKMPLELTTNGTKLFDFSVEDFTDSSLVQINFSLHSFFDNFPQGNISNYCERIFHFVSELHLKRPDIYINFRLWNHPSTKAAEDYHHLEHLNYNKMILDLVERFFHITIIVPANLKAHKRFPIQHRMSLHFDTQFTWPSSQQPYLGTRGTCLALKDQIAIHADGTVVPCCLDKEAKMPLGNILHQSLEEIYAAPFTQALRKGFDQGVLHGELCTHCSFRQRFKTSPSSSKK